MSVDKYPSIFSRQMKAIVYIYIALWCNKALLYVQIEHSTGMSHSRSLILWFNHSGMTEMLPHGTLGVAF